MLRWSRLRALVARILPRREPIDSLDAEIQTYLGCDIEARVRAGASPREARRAALADFGGVAQVKEQVREIRPGAWLDGLRQDIVYAFRALHHAPAFAWSVIGSLSLGIAAMVATIAFVNALLFRPFPGVADQDRLIEIKVLQAAGGEWVPTPTSTRDVDIVRNGFADAASVAAIETNAEVAVQVPDARVFNAAFVSVNYFDTLGVRAERGRTFALGEERPAASGVAVISHDAWERSFASDPQIVGRMARIGASRVQLIGVTPKGFVGIGQRMGRSGPDVWLPLGAADLVARSVPGWVSVPPSGEHLFRYVGRLAPQSRWPRLRAEADAVASRMASERARAVDVRADVVPLRMQDPAQLAEFVATIVPVPILVLAIACLNAANLLLARGASRSREIAVRLAIGAGRSRLVRQLLVESVLLAMGAMPCALLLAWSGLRVAERSVLVPMPLDGTVLALTCAISVASAVAMGLVPALRATDRHAALALNPSMGSDATPRRSRGRRALVVVQVALSLTLLATGMHLISALQSRDRVVGTAPDHLLIASIDLSPVGISADVAKTFYDAVLDRASHIPGVQAVGLASPRAVWTVGKGRQEDNATVVWLAGASPRDGLVVLGGYAGGQLIEALGLRVLQGRGFTHDDRRGTEPRVALVNTSFADQVLKGAALGQLLRIAPYRRGADDYPHGIEVRIVGVVEAAAEPSFTRGEAPVPALYVPLPLRDARALSLYVRSTERADTVAPMLRQTIGEVDTRVPVQFETLEQLNERQRRPQTLLARAAEFLGFVALVLAAWGVYAVVSYLGATRSREMAIRLAVGAQRGAMIAMVLKQSMTMATVGVAIGSVAAWIVGRVIQAEMHATPGTQVVALAQAIGVLGVAALVATAVPSLRAARIDPATLLKEQ